MAETIDSRQLRAFSLLARTGSFTQTARELNLSQSAISHAIKALEEEVSCRLLDRIGKKVTLTEAGEHFLVHADKILQTMADAREQLEQLSKWGRGRLRVAASPTACQYILPTVLREFKESFPQCGIHLDPGDTAHAIESLREHRADLALCMEPHRADARFEFRPLFTDQLEFIVSALHPWARVGKIRRDEIGRQNFILYTKTSYMFEMIQEYFRREKLVLPKSMELGSIEAIKALVKVGLGVTILAPWVARNETSERSLVALPLGQRKLKRRWGILHRRDQRFTLAEETFATLCEVATEKL